MVVDPGGERRLAPKLVDPGVATDLKQSKEMKTSLRTSHSSLKRKEAPSMMCQPYLLGVNRRELVGGPPAFSLAADLDMELLMFSFSSCGPLRLGSGVCGVEVC